MRKYLVCLILVFVVGFLVLEIYLPKTSLSEKEVIFNIEKGEGSREISLNLEKEGLIRSAPIFRIYVLTIGVAGRLQAGAYLLSPSMNTPKIAEKLFKGDSIKEKITIIEGWNPKDIVSYLQKNGIFQSEDFFEAVKKDYSGEYDFLKDKPKSLGLDGYLFPDTYEINREDGIDGLIKKALDNFNKKLTPDLRAEIKVQKKTIFEIITMASLIEKEVKENKDKKLVSGILWKRLKNGMPLQVDATINFITGKRDTKVSIEETKIDSPYNTYKYKGLPLGSISSPGLESILAAVYPEDSPYLYYLSAPEGTTIFSKTLEEHNQAKALYLK